MMNTDYEAEKTAKSDMKSDGVTLLKKEQVFTPEELDDLYTFDPDNENWWNR